jgi:hemoglobin
MESTIYDAIGGAPAMDAAVERFYEKVWGDPELSGYFGGVDRDQLKDHQRAFLTMALGGPSVYLGRSLEDAHRGRAITDAAFDRIIEHLSATLDELGVPAGTVGEIADSLAPTRSDVVDRTAPAGA